ncbi:MAG: hypothetical protein KF901_04085 [Myxococcales bacterium]|nr:hypothetical protein [Myxococcales bacterium]
MQLFVEILGSGDEVVRAFRRPLAGGIELGGDADLQLPERLLVHEADHGARCRYGEHGAWLSPASPIYFRLPEVGLRLTLEAAGRAITGGKGRCPRCSASLRTQVAGGAYRSFAREVRECTACRVDIVSFDEAGQTFGTFADVTANEWFWVATTLRCPGCGELMRRAIFRTARGQADVERCIPCGLVLVDEEDRRRLVG